MVTIIRQLVICLVIGFFICGLHCKILAFPELAKCEYDIDCLRGKATCVRRECHCTDVYDYGDGKNECTRWRVCTTPVCSKNSRCLMHPENSDVTCKCLPGFFGIADDPGCMSAALISGASEPYPCLFNRNCPTFSHCKDSVCTCYQEYRGDGELCTKYYPKTCSEDRHCGDKDGKCLHGMCRCVGMHAGHGDACREVQLCKDNFKCGRNQFCIIDPLFPHRHTCKCNDDAIQSVYEECLDCLQDSHCKDELQTCIAQVCTCKGGLARGDDKKCKPGPLHPCQDKNDCDTSAKCIKGKCFCQGGRTGNGKYCRISLPCKGNHECDGNSKCVVDPLIPEKQLCVCNDGFRQTVKGECVELTECFNLHGRDCPFGHICSQVSGGSYNCTCPEGYELITSGGNSSCQDVDECSDPGICSANSVCENSKGSYHCKCNEGYAKNGDGVCEDKDECSDIAEACGAHGKCVNEQGGYSCECEKGNVKKNRACVKVECKCKQHEVCYKGECRCKRPYKKNKKGHCVGVGLKAGSAQVSAYLSTFILGVLESLALSA